MLDRLKKFLVTVASKGGSPAAMKYINAYALLLLGCVGLYLVMTFYEWHRLGAPDLKEMREMISTLVSGAFVAAVSFVCKSYADAKGGGKDEKSRDDGNQKSQKGGGAGGHSDGAGGDGTGV